MRSRIHLADVCQGSRCYVGQDGTEFAALIDMTRNLSALEVALAVMKCVSAAQIRDTGAEV